MDEMTKLILTHEFQSHKFSFLSTPTAPALISEIFSDCYEVLSKNIEFRPGDIILDIGACEGMFSIMMSKLFPFTRIIAFEPVSRTYAQMMQNIKLNGCTNIETCNMGIGKPNQHTVIFNVSKDFSGGSTAFCTFIPDDHDQIEINLMTLNDVFEMYKIDRCRLFKIDVEGSEYDALYFSTILSRVDYMTAEFHMNSILTFQSRRMDALATWCKNQTNLIHVDFCQMAE